MQKLYPYRLYFLIAFSVLVYSHTLFHDFVFDDDIVLVKNQHVINGTEGIAKIWSTNYLNGYQQFNDALYRPLSSTVFNMVHSIAGLNPHAFHLVNILVYALLVFIVYKLFNQLFPRKEKYVFWGVLLFAVHPIHTEVVANIKSLDELLALLLGASASYYILLYKSGKNTLVQVFILYVLALFSKESAISFLLIIPLFYYFTEGKISYKKLGFLSLGLLTLTISWYLLHEYIINSMPREVDKGIFSASSNSIIGIENPFERFITGLWLVNKYFLKLIVPWPLFSDYSFNTIPTVSFISLRFWATIIFIGFSIWVFLKGFIKKKPLTLAILIFYIAIIPTSNVIIYIGTTFAERLAFTASLAVIPLIVSLEPWRFNFIRPIIIIIALVFSFLTPYRAADWKTNYSLYKADAERNPDSYRTHYNYASVLTKKVPVAVKNEEDRQNLELAIIGFHKAIEIMPDYPDARLNLSNAYKSLGQIEESLKVLDQIIALNPDYSRAYYNKGIVLYQQKRYEAARKDMLTYTNIGGNHLAEAWYFAGVCSGYLNDFQSAIDQLSRSVNLNQSRWESWNYLGMAYGNSQQWNKALQAFSKAYELNPSPEIQANIAMAQRAMSEKGNN